MSNQAFAAVLFVCDLHAVSRFYQQVVNLQIRRVEMDHVVLEKGDFRLTVHQIPHHYAVDIVITTPPEIRESTAIKLAMPVESISHARESAVQLGGCVYDSDREWESEGTTICDGWDPEGNVFQLIQASDRADAR